MLTSNHKKDADPSRHPEHLRGDGPSGCAGESDKRSDEIGIIAVGLGHDGIGRILEDATGHYSPDGWANKALELFDRWKGDKIVAEKRYRPRRGSVLAPP